jgi:hypothetical protein
MPELQVVENYALVITGIEFLESVEVCYKQRWLRCVFEHPGCFPYARGSDEYKVR